MSRGRLSPRRVVAKAVVLGHRIGFSGDFTGDNRGEIMSDSPFQEFRTLSSSGPLTQPE